MRPLIRVFPELPSLSVGRHCSKAGLATTLLVTAALGFGGCAQSPQQLAATPHSKEYFPASVYGPASRRVIADGEPVPHGGGQYLVGKPYTIAGQTYYPSERKVTQVGLASWYGDAFHGRLTANGEIYDRDSFTAAHPTMPLPSYARVTNLRNGYSMVVRVNDRGPYHSNRIMDVSSHVADALDIKRYGTSRVKVEYVGRASLAGSDDARLFATLRMNGPAPTKGLEENTMVAEAAPPPTRVASLAPYVPQSAQASGSAAGARSQDRDDRAVEAEAVRRPRRRLQLAASEGGPNKPAPSAASSSRLANGLRRSATPAPPLRREYTASAHGIGPKRTVRMASLERGASARAFAVHELMPPPRPDRASVRDAKGSRKEAIDAPPATSRGIVLPPSRPVRLAATAPAARRHAGGMRLTHPRGD